MWVRSVADHKAVGSHTGAVLVPCHCNGNVQMGVAHMGVLSRCCDSQRFVCCISVKPGLSCTLIVYRTFVSLM
jgi:hypothetical protein